ncbi:MAG TPA: 50S ribosomal protein L29 [Phycisphaerales bacterium]|nr:50S ribosomal protein L29 [Phycisphaerales bacterium]HMP36433.1 50S ribosomal protein L29 [Phycisphaerales bacterium]
MKMKEVRKLNDEEIGIEVARLRRRLFDLRSQVVTSKIEDTSQFGKTRTELARLLTEHRRRDLERGGAAARPRREGSRESRRDASLARRASTAGSTA